jgi:dUTP pyrophosphatase
MPNTIDIGITALSSFAGDIATFGPTEGNVGTDLIATATHVLYPGDRALIKTGIAIALPAHLEAQVRPRSGLALKHGLTVVNSPGTIDPSYRGEVGVIVQNTEPVIQAAHFSALLEYVRGGNTTGVEQLLDEYLCSLAKRTITIKRGDRFAQLVFAEFVIPSLQWQSDLDATERGTAGYGHSGV